MTNRMAGLVLLSVRMESAERAHADYGTHLAKKWFAGLRKNRIEGV